MRHSLNINGKLVQAEDGDTLVDAALSGKVLIPHDCATGQCETCRVRVAWGRIDDCGTAYGDTVLACQSRLKGDATITFDEMPKPETISCFVEDMKPLNHNVVEVTLRSKEVLAKRPGQYAKLALEGFPPREYSFTSKMNGTEEQDQIIFQIKRLSKGVLSSALGQSITKGHKGRMTGPFGSAYLREQETGPIILTASGTGFAPIWSVAKAVTLTQPKRPLNIFTGVNTPEDIYMQDAFRWLRNHEQYKILVTAKVGAHDAIRDGTPDMYLPQLHADTSVHVAGNPDLVDRVKAKALDAGALCYADPFTPSANKLSFFDRYQTTKRSLSNLFMSR